MPHLYPTDRCGGTATQYNVLLKSVQDERSDIRLDSKHGLQLDFQQPQDKPNDEYSLSRDLTLSNERGFGNTLASLSRLPRFSLLIGDAKVTVETAEGRYGKRTIETVVVTDDKKGTVVTGAACNLNVVARETDQPKELDAEHPDGPLIQLKNAEAFLMRNPPWVSVSPLTPHQIDQIVKQSARAPGG